MTTGANTFAGSSGNLAYRAGYTADLLASVYGLSGLYQAGDNGAGQTIAVVDEEPYLSSDIATYQSCYQTGANVSNVPVGSGVGTTLPSDDEAALDIETAISTAPEAAILVYQGVSQLQILQQIVSADRAKIISSSWATCESSSNAGIAHDYATVTQEAAVQGQSILASSGDNGSQCGATFGTQLPASDPNVTAVGGTTLYSIGPSGAEPYAAGRTPLEAVWNNQVVSSSPTGTGGGISAFNAMPSYQSGAAASLGVINADSGGSCGACRVPRGAGRRGRWRRRLRLRDLRTRCVEGDRRHECGDTSVVRVHRTRQRLGGVPRHDDRVRQSLALPAGGRRLRLDAVQRHRQREPAHRQEHERRLWDQRRPVSAPDWLRHGHRAWLDARRCARCRAVCAACPGLHGDSDLSCRPGERCRLCGVTAAPRNRFGRPSAELHRRRAATRPQRVFRRSDLRRPHHWWHLHNHCQCQRCCDQQREHSLHMDGHKPAPPPTVHKPSPPTVGTARLTGVGSRRPELSFFIQAGRNAPAVHSITAVLPSGLGLAHTSRSLHKGIRVKDRHGRSVSFSVSRERGQFVLGFKPAVSYVTVTVKGPALSASRSFARQVRAHKLKKIRLKVRIVDAASKTRTIQLTIKV